MFQQYFHQKDLVILPILTMLLFGAVFLAVLIQALRRRPDAQTARLPLEAEPRAESEARDAGGGHV